LCLLVCGGKICFSHTHTPTDSRVTPAMAGLRRGRQEEEEEDIVFEDDDEPLAQKQRLHQDLPRGAVLLVRACWHRLRARRSCLPVPATVFRLCALESCSRASAPPARAGAHAELHDLHGVHHRARPAAEPDSGSKRNRCALKAFALSALSSSSPRCVRGLPAGKSSLVCALCVGLAGGTKVRVRAHKRS